MVNQEDPAVSYYELGNAQAKRLGVFPQGLLYMIDLSIQCFVVNFSNLHVHKAAPELFWGSHGMIHLCESDNLRQQALNTKI